MPAPESASAYCRRMRGLDAYFSCSRLRTGTARAYSRRASSVAPLSVSSAMAGIVCEGSCGAVGLLAVEGPKLPPCHPERERGTWEGGAPVTTSAPRPPGSLATLGMTAREASAPQQLNGSIANPLQLRFGRTGRARVRVTLDHLLQRAAREGEIAGAFLSQGDLEHRVGRFVLIGEFVHDT